MSSSNRSDATSFSVPTPSPDLWRTANDAAGQAGDRCPQAEPATAERAVGVWTADDVPDANGVDHGIRGGTGEWGPPGDHLVEPAPEREVTGPRVRRNVVQPFWYGCRSSIRPDLQCWKQVYARTLQSDSFRGHASMHLVPLVQFVQSVRHAQDDRHRVRLPTSHLTEKPVSQRPQAGAGVMVVAFRVGSDVVAKVLVWLDRASDRQCSRLVSTRDAIESNSHVPEAAP